MQNKHFLAVAFIFSGTVGLPAQAHDNGYWKDSRGNIVRTPYECVRSIGWTTEKAVAECGGEMKVMKTEKAMEAEPVMATAKVMDADGDGVEDGADQCPSTAPGVEVNSQGCPPDSDNDGVADSYDQCPGTPVGVKVHANGCPTDSDGDGVDDNADQCPDTAPGTEVSANGCPVNTDSDGDGIVDASDQCPNTSSGTAVDKTGCELKADIRLDKVQFETATAILSPESRRILNGIAETLVANEHLSFEVAGHTDNRGDYNYNVQLSENRAQSVRDYLIDKGVSADRLTARGYGPDKPVASNDTRSGRSQNRRVELVLQ